MAGHVIPNPDIFILAIFHRGIPATRPVLKYISHTVAFEIFNNGYGMGPDQSEEMPGLPHRPPLPPANGASRTTAVQVSSFACTCVNASSFSDSGVNSHSSPSMRAPYWELKPQPQTAFTFLLKTFYLVCQLFNNLYLKSHKSSYVVRLQQLNRYTCLGASQG